MAKVILRLEVDGEERLDRFEVRGTPVEVRAVIQLHAGELYKKLQPDAELSTHVIKPVSESVTKPARGGRRKRG